MEIREGTTTIEADRLIRTVWKDPWDIREGNGCPGYQIPVFVEMKRNHRLGDQRVAQAFATLATTVVKIVLERNTDQIGNRVGELLGDVLLLIEVRIDIRSRAGWSAIVAENCRYHPKERTPDYSGVALARI